MLIGNFEGGKLSSSGTGFVARDGLVVFTNKHVVTGDDDTVDPCKLVFFSGTEKPRLVRVSADQIRVFPDLKRSDEKYHERDVAMITLKARVAEPLAMGESAELTETMPTWAFGFPQGTLLRAADDAELPSPTVHAMRIERVQRRKGELKVLQLGGSATYGNSGGPVVDGQGRIVGVIQAKDRNAPIVYAVPTAALEELADNERPAKTVAQEWVKPLDDGKAKPSISANARSTQPRTPQPAATRSVLADKDYTESDLEGLSAAALTILRNEPFARRGYVFKRRELRTAFREFGWYKPWTSDLPGVQRRLSARERRNVDFIRQFQEANGLQW